MPAEARFQGVALQCTHNYLEPVVRMSESPGPTTSKLPLASAIVYYSDVLPFELTTYAPYSQLHWCKLGEALNSVV